jgi:hypothetical protein
MRGGSATQYVYNAVGSGDSQFSRTFDQGSSSQGNVLMPVQGQQAVVMPTATNLDLIQNGGRRRKRGGFLGEVINQAIVPFALVGMQNTYRRKRGGRRTRRRSRR